MSRLDLDALEARYLRAGRRVPKRVREALGADGRKRAASLLKKLDALRTAELAEAARLRKMLRFETALWKEGVVHVAGVDEAGVSPLAGPIAAAAVVLPMGEKIARVDDSKVLDEKTRDELAAVIKDRAVSYCVAFAEPHEIDHLNPYWAGVLAMTRAVKGLRVVPDHLLIDARKVELSIAQTAIVKGDAKSLTIAAASILAKTTRDALMKELDREYPGYGFAKHKGYPVKEHVEALRRLGATPVHRRRYAPVAAVLQGEQLDLFGGA